MALNEVEENEDALLSASEPSSSSSSLTSELLLVGDAESQRLSHDLFPRTHASNVDNELIDGKEHANEKKIKYYRALFRRTCTFHSSGEKRTTKRRQSVLD